MRRLFLALLFAVASIVALLARSVSGTVVDGRGECVPFAAIYFKELHRGLSADSEGRYQIAAAVICARGGHVRNLAWFYLV